MEKITLFFKEKLHYALLLLLGLIFFCSGSGSYAKNGQIGEIKIYGKLVAEACTLRPGDELITVDFKEIVDKYLYKYGESPAEYFDIHLDDCDNSIFNTVSVMFSGNIMSGNDEILATDSGSVQGVGITIYSISDEPLKINKKMYTQAIEKGTNTLSFYAKVRGDADAIANKNIGLGLFTATATFTLFYD